MNLSHVPVSAVYSLAGVPLFYSQNPLILLQTNIDGICSAVAIIFIAMCYRHTGTFSSSAL